MDRETKEALQLYGLFACTIGLFVVYGFNLNLLTCLLPFIPSLVSVWIIARNKTPLF